MNNKWVWIGIMAVILIGGTLGGVLLLTSVCEKAGPKPIPDCPSGLICATSGEMCDVYDDNEITGDALYKGQNLRVSGRVKEVKRSAIPGNTYLELACPGLLKFGLRGYFTTENEDMLIGIEKGEDVLVTGVGSGYQTLVDSGFTYQVPTLNQITSVEEY
jgi:hypothetical protein